LVGSCPPFLFLSSPSPFSVRSPEWCWTWTVFAARHEKSFGRHALHPRTWSRGSDVLHGSISRFTSLVLCVLIYHPYRLIIKKNKLNQKCCCQLMPLITDPQPQGSFSHAPSKARPM